MAAASPRPSDPVVVGIAELANKDPERIIHPVTLIEEAVRVACDDAGADVLPWIGGVWSPPLSVFSNDDAASMVAERLGLPDGGRHVSTYSGAGPLTQLSLACSAIARGEIEGALIAGGIADASVRRARELGVTPPAPPTSMWSQGSDGPGEHVDRRNWDGRWAAEVGAGCAMPSSMFAVVESAIAADAGRTPDEHRAFLGELMAPFTEVAASRPSVSWFPEARTPDEIAGLGPDNRFVAEPYTKLMCSFPTVDLAAAVIVVSSSLADRLGIPAERRVHPLAIAKGSEVGMPSLRPRMDLTPSYFGAAERALASAGIAPEEIEAFDLYSCFPAAVQMGMRAFGIAPADPRPLTLTGGLPYMGGPGAAYTLHAIAASAGRARGNGGRVVATGGVGGAFHDFAVGLFSVEPLGRPARFETEPTIAEDTVEIRRTAEGAGVVVAATVLHERDRGAVEAPVIAELPDGSRVGARVPDASAAAALSRQALVGRTVRLHTDGDAVMYDVV